MNARLGQSRQPEAPVPRRVFVPADTAALAVGADAVAAAVASEAAARSCEIELVRNGSRGLFWLEPLVEVEIDGCRIAYGPIAPSDVPSLFDAGFLDGGSHVRGLGRTEDIEYLRRQERLSFARVGLIDPLSLDDYEAHGGLTGLRVALDRNPAGIVRAVADSGLRGRGGAAFPAGRKWRTVLQAEGAEKYVVCNADEGDSGTFSDRMLLEGDPFSLIEGMIIAGLGVGARKGYVYLRSEYPRAWRVFNAALAKAREAGLLGGDVLGSGRRFEIEARLGAGAYICGEETAMLESIEGRRGLVRAKPPLPAISGLFGKPTLINNVNTLVSVPVILANGAAWYRDYGMGQSRGTLAFQLAGNVKRGGLVEKAFGLTLGELLHDFGGGTASGRPIGAVQAGGPLGAYIPPAHFDIPLDYEAFASRGAMLGHGGIVVFDDTVDLARMARFAMEFCAVESCGKCVPCRIGSRLGVEVIDRLILGHARESDAALLEDLCATMADGSLCALGGLTPSPVRSVLRHFPAAFGLAGRQMAAPDGVP